VKAAEEEAVLVGGACRINQDDRAIGAMPNSTLPSL